MTRLLLNTEAPVSILKQHLCLHFLLATVLARWTVVLDLQLYLTHHTSSLKLYKLDSIVLQALNRFVTMLQLLLN